MMHNRWRHVERHVLLADLVSGNVLADNSADLRQAAPLVAFAKGRLHFWRM